MSLLVVRGRALLAGPPVIETEIPPTGGGDGPDMPDQRDSFVTALGRRLAPAVLWLTVTSGNAASGSAAALLLRRIIEHAWGCSPRGCGVAGRMTRRYLSRGTGGQA
ncbi:hypothetical protein Ga0080574_TMP3340 [Salipiger abyssi]|uniref:Uncharacterized protein n=1 Tax=Salipiger abyssi TaxID=1250539 RepID=A0A1P8UW99_9RHOB|nr:hypothetical protein Ga0080574_TMP3340 [Salipiger abyssi]